MWFASLLHRLSISRRNLWLSATRSVHNIGALTTLLHLLALVLVIWLTLAIAHAHHITSLIRTLFVVFIEVAWHTYFKLRLLKVVRFNELSQKWLYLTFDPSRQNHVCIMDDWVIKPGYHLRYTWHERIIIRLNLACRLHLFGEEFYIEGTERCTYQFFGNERMLNHLLNRQSSSLGALQRLDKEEAGLDVDRLAV